MAISKRSGRFGDEDKIRRLIADAQAGSPTALAEVIRLTSDYLTAIARRELQPQLRAKLGGSDVVQDTLFEAQRDFAQFHGATKQELLRWLRRILHNNLKNVERSFRETAKREIAREQSIHAAHSDGPRTRQVFAVEAPPDARLVAAEERASLEQALAQLPVHFRDVIVQRHFESRAFSEIADNMGRSEDAVRKLWFRGLERLETILRRTPNVDFGAAGNGKVSTSEL